MTTAIFQDSKRFEKKDLIEKLRDSGVDTRPFFAPLSSLNAFKDAWDTKRAKEENTNSYKIASRGINLPSHYNIVYSDVVRIKEVVSELI